MKKKLLIISLLLILFTSSCTITKDNLENAKIYTTTYPIKYLTQYLYSTYAEIESIYPVDADINSYTLSKKQLKEFASGDIFVYNGLTNEKEIAKSLVNKNKNLLIIDVSYGLSLENDVTELWLSPNNYLMLAKNIKDNLLELVVSKMLIEEIENNFDAFEEKISLMDASLHSIGKKASDNNKNVIIASDNTFKYLEHYGFEVISLENEENLKENKLNSIKSNFKSQKYKYILYLNNNEKSDIITELTDDYDAKIITVEAMTMNLSSDYFDIMTDYIDNINTIVSN